MGVSDRVLPLITVTGTTLLVSCSGGGYAGSCGSYGSSGSYGSCGAPGAVGADGVYEGTLTSTTDPRGTPVVAIIAENGQGRMSGADGSYYRLSVGANGTNLNGSFNAYSQGAPLANGAQTSSGGVTGVITSAGLNVTLTDQTNAQQPLTLTFDNVYNSGSALGTLAGNWTSAVNGLTLRAVIQADGAFTALDSANCTYSGAFSLIDPTFDTYAETHVRTCNGVNVTFTGLAAFLPATGTGTSGTPTQIKLLTDNDAGDYLVADLE